MIRIKSLSATLLTLVLICMSSLATGQELPASDANDLAMLGKTVNWSGLMFSGGLIFIAWILLRFVDGLVESSGKAFAERRLTLHRFNAFFHFFVYIGTIIAVIFMSFELSEQVLAVISGAIFISIGFATRDLLASLVAGVMIIFDRPFQVGDRVKFAGEYGDILNIGLRSVKLCTLDDSTVTIPNNLFLSEVASSGNSGELDMQIMIDFYIGLDQDVDLARELVRQAAATAHFTYLNKPIVVLVKQVVLDNCIGLQIRLKAYVLDTQYEKLFETDITIRVLEAFKKNRITPPAVLHSTAPVHASTLSSLTGSNA